MTCALVVESQPSPIASATGASAGSVTAVASRTIAGPVPLCPPVVWVRKSWVEAHPHCLDRTGGLQLADHPELETIQGRLECLDLRDEVHQLATFACCPQRLGQLGDPSAHAGKLGDEGAGRVRHI